MDEATDLNTKGHTADASEGPLPFVSVTVVVKNEARYIRECLESLLLQEYPRERYEVVLIDGGSTDGTLAIAEEVRASHGNLRIIERPGCTYPGGLNFGIEVSQGEIWTFVDGHARVQPDFLSRNVRSLRETGAACTGGVIQTHGEGFVGGAIAAAMSTPFGVGNARFRHSSRYSPKAGYVDTVPYGAYRKDIVLRIGGFDESRLRSADIDMNNRIRRLGGKFYLSPDIRTRYYSRPTVAAMTRQAFANGLPLGRTIRVASLRHFVPALFVGSLLALGAMSLVFPWARVILLAVVGTYALLDILYSTLSAAELGWLRLPLLIALFPLLHLSYGIGSIAGIARDIPRLFSSLSSRGGKS